MLSASHVNLVGHLLIAPIVNSHHYDAKIVINCEHTYTPDRNRLAVRTGGARPMQLLRELT